MVLKIANNLLYLFFFCWVVDSFLVKSKVGDWWLVALFASCIISISLGFYEVIKRKKYESQYSGEIVPFLFLMEIMIVCGLSGMIAFDLFSKFNFWGGWTVWAFSSAVLALVCLGAGYLWRGYQKKVVLEKEVRLNRVYLTVGFVAIVITFLVYLVIPA
jgi:hypothetical protein